jgi:heat shock protein HtpX
MAFLFAAAMNLFAYWFSDKMILRRYRAHEVKADSGSRLYPIVSDLAGKAGLPMPKVFVIPEQNPNAFATGRNPHHAAVAATEGILNILDDDELSGVMAHELAHVKHRMAVSRVREYAADKGGAEISRKPLALASALGKLQRGVQAVPLSRGNPAYSHMFIMNPFFGGLQKLFSTHPPAEERIRRLRLIAEQNRGQ